MFEEIPLFIKAIISEIWNDGLSTNKNTLSVARSHISKIALTSILFEDSQYKTIRLYSIAESHAIRFRVMVFPEPA
jgi:hypothetical protein